MHFLSRVADYVTLSLLWVLCSLPIVTLGASTTALYRVAINAREDKQTNSSAFFAAFRANFKKATILWLILLAVGAILVFCIWALPRQAEDTSKLSVILMYTGAFMLFLLCAFEMAHTFPMLAYFENSVGAFLRNSLLLSLLSPLRTIACAVLMLLPFLVLYFMTKIFLFTLPLWICLWPGMASHTASGLLLKIYHKYLIPKTDEDSDPKI